MAEVVWAAMIEVMTNPEVLTRLQPPPVRDVVPVQPSCFGRLAAKIRDAVAATLS